MYILLEGGLSIIADEKIYKRINFEVRKKRRRREKAIEKARDQGNMDEVNNLQKTESDYPIEEISKSEFRILDHPGNTFGNDKVISSKNFRPSFGLSCSEVTKVLQIPVRTIEEAIKKMANSGENKEKTDFMKMFPWFENFT